MGVDRAESRSGDEPMHRPCPRCSSDDTTFAYFNNGNRQQPRYRCKGCQRHWTVGGTLRTVPLGAAIRKKTKTKSVGAAVTAATWSDSEHTGRADSQDTADTDGDTKATDTTASRRGAGDGPLIRHGRTKSGCLSHPSSPSHGSSALKPVGHSHTTRAKTAPRKESSLESAVTSCHTVVQAPEKMLSNSFLQFPSGGGLLGAVSLPSLGRLLASDMQQGYVFPPSGSQHHKQQQAISDFVDHLDLKVEDDCEHSCGESSLEAMILGRHNHQQQQQQQQQCSSVEQQPRLFHGRGLSALPEQNRPLMSFHSLPSLSNAAPGTGSPFSQGVAQKPQTGLHLNQPHHHHRQPQDHQQLQQQGSGGFGQQAGYLHQISQMMHSQHLADGGMQQHQHQQVSAAAAVSGSGGGSVTSGSLGSVSNHLSRLSPSTNPTFQFPNYVLPLNLASVNPHSPRHQDPNPTNPNPHQLHLSNQQQQQQQANLGSHGASMTGIGAPDHVQQRYNNPHTPQSLFPHNSLGLMQADGRFCDGRAVPPYGMSQEQQQQQQQQQNQLTFQFQYSQNQHFQQQQLYHQHHQPQNPDHLHFLHLQQQQQQQVQNQIHQQQQDVSTIEQQPRQQQQFAGYMLDNFAGKAGITDDGGGVGLLRSSNNPPAQGLYPGLSQSLVMGDSGNMPDLIDSSLIPELPAGFMGGDLSLGSSISVL